MNTIADATAARTAALAEVRANINASREQVAQYEATANDRDVVVCAVDAAVMVLQERGAGYGFKATNTPVAFDAVTAARLAALWNRRQPGHPVRRMSMAQWCMARRMELADCEAQLPAV